MGGRMMAKSNRQSGIELLRILTACAVVMLHYNDGKAFTYVAHGGKSNCFIHFRKSLYLCS